MALKTSQPPLIPASRTAPRNVRAQANALRASNPVLAEGLDGLQAQVDYLMGVLRSDPPSIEDWYVTDVNGKLLAWVGDKVVNGKVYWGGYFGQLYVGGTDPTTAPFFVGNAGKVVIGQNGSVSVRNDQGAEKGWLGVQVEAAKNVTGAVNSGSGLIRLTVVAHGYATGDAVVVAGVGGVPNATGDWPVTVIDADHFDLNGSTWAGAYTSGGTVYRYYGGILAQTAGFGGDGTFAGAKIRCWADGHVTIADASFQLTQGSVRVNIDGTSWVKITNLSSGLYSQLTDWQLTIADGGGTNKAVLSRSGLSVNSGSITLTMINGPRLELFNSSTGKWTRFSVETGGVNSSVEGPASVNGTLLTTDYITVQKAVSGYAQPMVLLDTTATAKVRFTRSINEARWDLFNNVAYDGANFYLDDTTKAGVAVCSQNANPFYVTYYSAGVGARTGTTLLSIDTGGNIIVNGYFKPLGGYKSSDATAGITGSITLSLTTDVIQYKDWASVNQSKTFVTTGVLTTNAFKDGLRTT